ncbi:MAG: DUF3237 domain-containing protein [Burkholderiaceae bacterium]
MIKLPEPTLSPLCHFEVMLAAPMEMGMGPGGRRRIIPIIGGRVTGERLQGTILNLGADWQTVYADSTAFLDTRYAMQTDDGAIIEIRNLGLRHGPPAVMAALARGESVDPASYSMRTHARFETGDPRYDWVNRVLAVGVGAREASAVHLNLYEIL